MDETLLSAEQESSGQFSDRKTSFYMPPDIELV